jgi:hypothetical protein
MKQVSLITLLLAGVYLAQAQNSLTGQTVYPPVFSDMLIPVVEPAEAVLLPAAHYIGDKYKGLWISHYPNGNRCDSGFLQNSMPDGLWKSWYPNGNLRMVIECSARRLSSTKDEMQRIYKPGYNPAPGVREMGQALVNSTYPYDKLMYRQMYFATHPPDLDDNNTTVEVQVQSGDGSNSFKTDSPPFTECLVHGLYKTWFEDGTLKDSGYCENGVREGVWQEWDDATNMRAVGFYKNGLRFKDWRYYNSKGKLEFIKWYNRMEEVTETIVLK